MDFLRNFYPNKDGRDSLGTSQHIDKNLFIDSRSADEFVCKICQLIVVDPYEHIPKPEVKCDSIFCHACAKLWIDMKKTACPVLGCIASGFTMASLRPLGTRETSRLSNLKVRCEFNCTEIVGYGEYFAHRSVCPGNPSNVCRICETPKKEGAHDCKKIFNSIRDWNNNLERENHQLKDEIVDLKLKLEDARTEISSIREQQEHENQQLKNEITNLKKKLQEALKFHAQGEKLGMGSPQGEINETKKQAQKSKKNTGKVSAKVPDKNQSSKPRGPTKSSQPTVPAIKKGEFRDWLVGPIPQYRFHSNCNQMAPAGDRIILNFHYAERSYKIDQVDPNIRFRTLRSLLTDKIGHDPGQIVFLQHRVLQDFHTIGYTGIPLGPTDITFVPVDTPDYGQPGFQLLLYRLKNSNILSPESGSNPRQYSSPLEELTAEALGCMPHIKFFSNNLPPQAGHNQIKLKLRFNDKSCTIRDAKPEMTWGDVRRYFNGVTKEDPGKMLYLTHRVLKDDMTVAESGIPLGLTNLTLLLPSFPEPFQPGRVLELMRFRNTKMMKSSGPKLTQSSRASSVASLF